MHPLPQPPSDIDTFKNWAIFLAGIAWVVYQTWQSKVAAKTAADAKAVADVNTERLNGHAKIIQGVKDTISDVRGDITPAPVVAAALGLIGAAVTTQAGQQGQSPPYTTPVQAGTPAASDSGPAAEPDYPAGEGA